MYRWFGEACGNTFLVLLASDGSVERAKLYLDNLRSKRSWFFDSALVLSSSDVASIRMRVLERDGTESTMCGNGLRVVGALLDRLGLERTVQCASAVMPVEAVGGDVFRAPLRVKESMLSSSESLVHTYFVSGEPHVVVAVPDVTCAPTAVWGHCLAPHANCTVVSRVGRRSLLAQTFERGVNAVTQSCGTGACAAAYLFRDRWGDGTYRVRMHSSVLRVHVSSDLVVLEGRATARRLSSV